MRVPFRGSDRRLLLIALVCSATVLPLAGSPAVASAAEATVVGELVQVWPENETPTQADQGESGPVSFIEPDHGDSVRVPTEDVEGLPLGSTVKVRLGDEVTDAASAAGLMPARAVLSTKVLESVSPSAPLSAAAAPVNHDVTVVRVLPPGGVADATTVAQLVDAVNGPVNGFWTEQTSGAITLAATGWPTWVTTTGDCTDPLALWDEVADAVGFVPAPDKHLLIFIPDNQAALSGCGTEVSEVGFDRDSGGTFSVRGTLTAAIGHGLGHNFGLDHSEALQCAGGAMEEGSNICRRGTDGDPYDVMGKPWAQLGSLNSLQAARLGVLPTAAQKVIDSSDTSGSTYTLLPWSDRSGGVRALRISAGGRVYWLEYRTATGRDAWLASPTDNSLALDAGVLLRRTGRGSEASLLLDPTPFGPVGGATDHVALPVGQAVGQGRGFQVTVVSVTPSAATVRVTGGGGPSGDPACARRASTSMTGVALLVTDDSAGALVTGLDHGLWYRPLFEDDDSWQSLGGWVQYGPAAVAAGSTSYLFAVGMTGELWYRTDSGAGWGPWRSLGGYLTASPAAASLGDGHVRVFGRGVNGDLWSRELRNGTWSPWIGHGGYLTSPPTATAVLDQDRTEVLVRGMDGYSYAQSLPRGAGAGTYVRRNILSCTAVALNAVQGVSDIYPGAYADSYNGGPRLLGSVGDLSLGGAITSTPAVSIRNDEFLFVGRGLDNALWLFDGLDPGHGWISLGGYVL